jgi:isoleucyl-tRNA synthetase
VDAYRKLRNTFRYMLGNLSDFDPQADAVAPSEMTELDQWILLRGDDLITRCRAWYDNFEFHKIYHAVYAFATVDLSSVYFDVLKDRLYTSATKSSARRGAQTALYRILDCLVRLLAPLMSFTAEEVWGHMNRPDSIHMAYFPEPGELSAGLDDAARKRSAAWDRLMQVRDVVLKSLDTARNEKLIGAPLEARVLLSADPELYTLLTQYAEQLPGLFIVSEVGLERVEGDLAVKVERATGDKCERCWKYTKDVGSDPEFPTICAPCAGAVHEILHA